jgi:ABC-type proline/glycine betaine transport system permease subunit
MDKKSSQTQDLKEDHIARNNRLLLSSNISPAKCLSTIATSLAIRFCQNVASWDRRIETLSLTLSSLLFEI